MTRVQDIMVACLLVGVMILAFCGVPGCAAAPPPAPKWSDRVPVMASVLLRGDGWACSGVAIDEHEVLTAAHCIRGPMKAIVFPGIEVGVTVVRVDAASDVALLRVAGAPLTAVAKLATELPAEGDLLFLTGFGCYGSIMVAPGLFLGVAPDKTLAVAAGVCLGDSGGPAFNERGEVFGVLSMRSTTSPTAFVADVRGW